MTKANGGFFSLTWIHVFFSIQYSLEDPCSHSSLVDTDFASTCIFELLSQVEAMAFHSVCRGVCFPSCFCWFADSRFGRQNWAFHLDWCRRCLSMCICIDKVTLCMFRQYLKVVILCFQCTFRLRIFSNDYNFPLGIILTNSIDLQW